MPRTTRLRESRFQLLATLLAWEGELRNGRLQELLGVTSVQASRLIAQFRSEFPTSLEHDAPQKRWVLAGEAPAPGGLDSYMATLEAGERWFEDGRVDFLIPDRCVFAALRAACVGGTGVELIYSSLTQPKGQLRTLYPQTLVRLSQRWHVRAWCTQRKGYADFNLGRMTRVRLLNSTRPFLPADDDWNLHIDVRLSAHSSLSAEHEQVVRTECFAGAAARRLRVRRALAGYVINDIRAATDPARQTPPDYLLEVLNVSELGPYLFRSPSQFE
ncbi:WYL domain-containing protein (plasmid) [Synechocystis sp. B12]|nr:WYL domain-containing protein [Synechocystis sp. B12]